MSDAAKSSKGSAQNARHRMRAPWAGPGPSPGRCVHQRCRGSPLARVAPQLRRCVVWSLPQPAKPRAALLSQRTCRGARALVRATSACKFTWRWLRAGRACRRAAAALARPSRRCCCWRCPPRGPDRRPPPPPQRRGCRRSSAAATRRAPLPASALTPRPAPSLLNPAAPAKGDPVIAYSPLYGQANMSDSAWHDDTWAFNE